MITLEEARQKYINDDADNPKYIFHGHYQLREEILPRKPELNMTNNPEDTIVAIYGSTKIDGAIPYILKIEKEWDDWMGEAYAHYFIIPDFDYEVAWLQYGTINSDSTGYLYVLDASSFVKSNDYQWVSITPMSPIEIIKVSYPEIKGHFRLPGEKFSYKGHSLPTFYHK